MSGAEQSPSTTDRALLRAFRAWGGRDFDESTARFSADWQDRLRPHWPQARKLASDVAWSNLRRDHEGSSRPDPARVHPTWFVRALKGESPAIRRAVVANAPATIREALRRGLNIPAEDLATDRPPDPIALGWALSLWTERLVGDVPDREDDPAVIVAMTRLGERNLARLIKVSGLVKHAFAVEGNGPSEFDEAIARFTPVDRVRLGYFRRHIGTPDPRLIPLARVDLQVIKDDCRRAHSRLGLVTFGRLLASVEPHRARWALQHVPYPVAQAMRTKPNLEISRKALLAWEAWILEAAWARLLAEGRLSGRRPDELEGDFESGGSL